MEKRREKNWKELVCVYHCSNNNKQYFQIIACFERQWDEIGSAGMRTRESRKRSFAAVQQALSKSNWMEAREKVVEMAKQATNFCRYNINKYYYFQIILLAITTVQGWKFNCITQRRDSFSWPTKLARYESLLHQHYSPMNALKIALATYCFLIFIFLVPSLPLLPKRDFVYLSAGILSFEKLWIMFP